MKELILKVKFDRDITLLIFRKKNNILKYRIQSTINRNKCNISNSTELDERISF